MITRYQIAATSSRGTGRNSLLPMAPLTNCSSIMNGTAITSDVVFSIEMVSFPVGGTITRMACGMTIRRSVVPRFMPSAVDASHWPLSTELSPERTISDRYAPSFRPRPRMAAIRPPRITSFTSIAHSGPNGMPSTIFGYSTPNRPQNVSWVMTGVPRKNQM